VTGVQTCALPICALEDGTDPVLVVTPADQTIADQPEFIRAIQLAVREAATGTIVILGVDPDRPETGYGYIQIESDSNSDQKSVRAVFFCLEDKDKGWL
jgi:mannose-1-phosphate guanylyltransferase/mannose-6-phosphate isomerase